MSAPSPGEEGAPGALPEARPDDRRRLSTVWLIPLVALLAALWLGYRAYMDQGPLITITFQTAEGIEAGKTRVRFKDVDIGMVEAIELARDLDGVVVHARLDAHVARYLNDEARFWVVRPRLNRSQVSGLSTLVGGSYIAADLSAGGPPRERFTGLEEPPLVAASTPGTGFTLVARSVGSLAEGAPVLHHGIDVGRVVGFRLRDDDRVAVHVFVDAPHDALVRPDTRFWNVSGIGVKLDAGGVRVDFASLTSVLVGGVAFANPETGQGDERAGPGSEFTLHPDREMATSPRAPYRQPWQLTFTGSVRGLDVGAPVEFRGIRIGEVTDIALEIDTDARSVEIPVTIGIEPARLGVSDPATPDGDRRRALWDELVAKGLRAQLRTGNLLTGARHVDLDFYPDAAKAAVEWAGTPPRLPTVPTPLDELGALVTKLTALPLDDMGDDLATSLDALQDTTATTNRLLERLERETAPELNRTLAQARSTLATVEGTLETNSPLYAEARRVLQELGTAARSLRIMADYLERHPEALLRGKGGKP